MSFRYPTLRVGQFTETTETFELFDDDAPNYEERTIDLTTAEGVTLTLEHTRYGWTPLEEASCTISDPEAGEVTYTFSPAETVVTGRYYVQFEINWGAETELIPPAGEEWILDIGRRLAQGTVPLTTAALDADEATIGRLQATDAAIAQLTSPLDAGGNTISNVGDSQSLRDAVPQEYVDNIAGANITGLSNPLTAPLDANNYPIQNPGPIGSEANPVDEAHVDVASHGRMETPARHVEPNYGHEARATTSGEQLFALNDLTKWEVVDGTATTATDSYLGDTSIQLGKDSTHTRSWIRHTFASPVDMHDVDFALAAKLQSTDDTTHLIRIQLTDDRGQNRFYALNIQSDAAGTWIRRTPGYDQDNSATHADLRNITSISIRSISGTAHSYLISDLRVVPKAETGTIMFSFDDGNDTDYTEGFPRLGEYGFPGTSFVNTGAIGTTGKLTLPQLNEMQDRGWEVCSHGEFHDRLSALTEAEQRAHLGNARRWLRENDFWRGSRTHRATYSDYDASALNLFEDYFEMAVTKNGGDTGGAATPGSTRLIGAQGADDYLYAKKAIDATVEARHTTVLTFHGITDGVGFSDVVSHAKDYVDAGELRVTTPSRLLDREIGTEGDTGSPKRRMAESSAYDMAVTYSDRRNITQETQNSVTVLGSSTVTIWNSGPADIIGGTISGRTVSKLDLFFADGGSVRVGTFQRAQDEGLNQYTTLMIPPAKDVTRIDATNDHTGDEVWGWTVMYYNT